MASKKKITSILLATGLIGVLGACGTPEQDDTLGLGGADSDINITEEPVDQSMSDHEHMDHGMMDHDSMNHAMDLGEADAEYELRFIDAMIPHHQGALIMAQDALENSSRDEIRALATDIIEEQQIEILEMQQWREEWYPDAPATPTAWDSATNQTVEMSPEQMSNMLMSMDLGTADDQFDLRFIDAMIPHHQAAIDMAQDALEKSDNPELQALAQNIIMTQEAEINQLEQWRQEWY